MVCVGPPLSCKPPRRGLTLTRSAATQPPLPDVLPMRLKPRLVTIPSTSGPLVAAVFPAMMVLARVAVPPPSPE